MIHVFFAPLAWLILQVDIEAGWFLAGFALLLLFYRGVVVEWGPLYLSGLSAIDVMAETIEQRQSRHFIDLGAGIGSMIVPLARAFPECHFTGVEYSPMSWLIGWLRTRKLGNVDWRYANLWSAPLANFDLAYAFLSPAPMPQLASKFDAEMRPGGLLISNSFFIQDREADAERQAGEMTLFFYEKPPA
jgi:cyclopropane fatty-acyl-phospholipid synthase-like methyltransferase